MKKSIVLSMLVAFAFALVACGGSKDGANTTVLKLALAQQKEHVQYVVTQKLSDEFYKRTNGAYRIEITPNELLGSQKDSLELVQKGVIAMTIVGHSVAETVLPDFSVLSLPYMYDSLEHQKKVFKDGTFQELFDTAPKAKLHVLAAYTSGVRSIYTDKPVRTPADLKGYKMRSMESPTMIAIFNAMGAIATPMSFGEVYTALSAKVINAAENNEISYVDTKHYEVAPVFSYTKHLIGCDLLLINEEVFNKMSDEHKAILVELMQQYIDDEYELWVKQVASSKEIAVRDGSTFIEDVDTAAFRRNVQPVIDGLLAKSALMKKSYNKVRAAVK